MEGRPAGAVRKVRAREARRTARPRPAQGRVRGSVRALLLGLAVLLAARPIDDGLGPWELSIVPAPTSGPVAPSPRPPPRVLAMATQGSAWACAKACARIFEANPSVEYKVIADVSGFPLGTRHIAATAARKLFQTIVSTLVPEKLRPQLRISFQTATSFPRFEQPGLQNITSSPFSIGLQMGGSWEVWSGEGAEERVLERLGRGAGTAGGGRDAAPTGKATHRLATIPRLVAVRHGVFPGEPGLRLGVA